jgi:hypothetical protein
MKEKLKADAILLAPKNTFTTLIFDATRNSTIKVLFHCLRGAGAAIGAGSFFLLEPEPEAEPYHFHFLTT